MWLNLHIVLHKRIPYRSFLAAPDMISNVNSLAIVTSSICKPRAIVMSHRSIVLTLYLWTLSSSQWRCQPGRFSMAAHRHDRRGIYRCVLLRFRVRIEIDHSYGLRCRGLCCHCRHSTRGAGRRGRKRPRDGRPHSCCAGSGSTNHSSADRIVVNSYSILLKHLRSSRLKTYPKAGNYWARFLIHYYRVHLPDKWTFQHGNSIGLYPTN